MLQGCTAWPEEFARRYRQQGYWSDITLNENSGIRAIIDSAMVSYERLPMLEIVFDRLVHDARVPRALARATRGRSPPAPTRRRVPGS